jgi:glycolate oxidase iron-sulfur subunit
LQKNILTLELADQCVKCGLCLPHCPTYQYSHNESESPRGRIALVQGLAENKLLPDAHLLQHIDTCLLCRNCERVCPAAVKVGKIIDSGRILIHDEKPAAQSKPFLLNVFTSPVWMRFLNNTLWCYQSSGLKWLIRKLNLLAFTRLQHVEHLLPTVYWAKKQRRLHSAKQQTKGCIALFIGCLGETFEQQTTQALIKLLNRLGYHVDVVAQQTCCGAHSLHSGETQQRIDLARQNIKAFSNKQYDAILYSATGCGIQLQEYAALPWSDSEAQKQAEQFVNLLEEATFFLKRITWPETISFSRLHKKVAVHEPCSQKNVLRQNENSSELLKNIPGLESSLLNHNETCCGGAGMYMLTHGKLAQALRQPKIEAACGYQNGDKMDIIVTTNPGCSLFLGAGLASEQIRVVHPAVLLAEQLNKSS